MNNALQKSGSRMNAALTKLGREAKPVVAVPAPSVSPSSYSAPPSPAVASPALFQRCVCAKFDLEYLMRFERQESGRYRAVESIRVHDGDSASSGGAPSRVLRVDQITGRYTPCPWCGDTAGRLYHCDCGAAVCGGRVKGNLFTCRDSCGDQWEMGPPAREIHVSEAGRDEHDFKPGARRPASWQAPARALANPAGLLPPARGRR
jgi:hypothetical protein